MGFHSFLQMKAIPLESAMAKAWNLRIFRKLRGEADAASLALAEERGALPGRGGKGRQGPVQLQDRGGADRQHQHHLRRHQRLCRTDPRQRLQSQDAVGLLCGAQSAPAKASGAKNLDTQEVWQSIVEQEGSVQHLAGLSDEEKMIYKTAFELDQRWIIELAADRTPFICQSQSLNLFLPADIGKWDMHMFALDGLGKGNQEPLLLPVQIHQPCRFCGPA